MIREQQSAPFRTPSDESVRAAFTSQPRSTNTHKSCRCFKRPLHPVRVRAEDHVRGDNLYEEGVVIPETLSCHTSAVLRLKDRQDKSQDSSGRRCNVLVAVEDLSSILDLLLFVSVT